MSDIEIIKACRREILRRHLASFFYCFRPIEVIILPRKRLTDFIDLMTWYNSPPLKEEQLERIRYQCLAGNATAFRIQVRFER